MNENLKVRQIVTHFTDNDLYTFSVQYYILQTYPRAEVNYTFFDRNNRVYPKGFDKLLRNQINGMKDVVITDEEIAFMKKRCYFLPDWYFTFLKGYRFDPNEVNIFQDNSGYLTVSARGKWYSTVMWEMPILSTISELMHIIDGDIGTYDVEKEYQKSYSKMEKALKNGLFIGDMGTRRRFSFAHHDNVIRSFKDCIQNTENCTGRFTGTSNVYFGMKYDLPVIGTMSHQIISFEENVSGLFECNYSVMKKFSDVYDGDNGIYLYDCFGDKIFFSNLSKKMAMMYKGLRIDSGDEREQTEKIINKYKELGIDPSSKQIVYSNALTIDKAIDLHNYVNGRVQDSYGLGTHLCADVDGCGYSNIVMKLTQMRITENREWHDCVKLSCDKGKTLGNPKKCDFLLSQIPFDK